MANSSSSNNKNESTDKFATDSGIYFPYPQSPTSPVPSDTSTDPLQSTTAPNARVYLNMGDNSQRKGATSVELRETTSDLPGSHPYANYPLPSSTIQRQNDYQRPHRSKVRNRYPYIPFYERRRPKILHAPALGLYASRNKRDALEDEEDNRPPRGFLVVLRLIFFVLAIEFMEALEIALTVPLLTSLYVDESYYSMAWLISPIIGFFLQPVVGMWSDTCKCRWGRRRPFILAFAIGAYIGIALILNSADLGKLLGDPLPSPTTTPIRAVLFIGVGVTLLDFCGDTANSPIRAYLIDTTNPADQERGFILHAILGGIGGGLGFTAGTIKWPSVPMFAEEGGQFSIIFYIATFICIVSTILTLTSIREEPLVSPSSSDESDSRKNSNDHDLDNFNESPEIELDERRPLLLSDKHNSKSATLQRKTKRSKSNKYINNLKQYEGFVEFDPATGERVPYDHITEKQNDNVLLQTFDNSPHITSTQMTNSESANMNVLQSQEFGNEIQKKAKLVKLGLMRRPSSDNDIEEKNVTIKSMLISMIRMPPRLWKLMICQVIGSAGYYATHLYFTEFMAIAVYNGTTGHEHAHNSTGTADFEKGVEMGCWGLFVFALSGAIYAFCMECWFSERVSLRLLYFIGYFVYVIGCTINFFFQQVALNIAMCFTFGILVVSIKTLPFQMLSQFHADETYRNRDGTRRGIGIDCSLLNSCIFLGELIIAASLSPLVKVTSVKYCMLVAAGLTFFGNIVMLFLFYLKS